MSTTGGSPDEPTVPRGPEETPTLVVESAPDKSLQFTPGTVLGGRYRIVSLIGRGGMGEVYRADDLKLGQTIALKFLPTRTDARLEQRLYEEVRIGRQVSHPNVCRLYDIAELEGHLFITMEFVDGEDLASLLRRVGRLPNEKALAVARDLCAGLAAAHEKGVIHRDLKPGNVMIDGRGRARITDFGLAVVEERRAESVIAGTPAYMAPEQLEGEPASQQSDIYALGLILYEIFTGQRTFAASSTLDLVVRQRAHDFSRPSSVVREISPAIERLIIHCLEADPPRRPQAVYDIVRELPGGDPLAAAIAAGETPTPGMVAAAAERGDLSVRAALGGLAFFTIALLTFAALTSKTMLYNQVAILKSPEVLQERVNEVLAATRQPLRRADWKWTFTADDQQLPWMKAHPSTRMEVMPFGFFYKQSPELMQPLGFEQTVFRDDPPLLTSGMAEVQLDSAGRLTSFVIVPPQLENAPPKPMAVDWTPFLALAGTHDHLSPSTPSWAAPVDSDQKAGWKVGRDGTRIEAAAYHGRPVWFAVIQPWNRPERMPTSEVERFRISAMAGIVTIITVWVAAVLLALRNLRRGQGDRRGALRFAAFIFVTCDFALFLRAHFVGGIDEFSIIGKIHSYTLLLGCSTWLAYIAAEPLVRRRWPRMLIGWSRVLAGRFRDPMVGRDLLAGLAGGLVTALFFELVAFAPGTSPLWIPPSALSQFQQLGYWIVRSLVGAAFGPVALVTFPWRCTR